MLLARSAWWKLVVTFAAAAGFVWLFEVTMRDSRYVRLPLTLVEPAIDPTRPPEPGQRIAFAATAYCRGMVTSSGVPAQRGVVAADPSLLPVGSVVELDLEDDRYDGIYTVLDTGPAVEGREVDLYMWNCVEAQRFGRKPVRMTVLRLGWNPGATARPLIERILGKSAGPEPLPSRPLPWQP